MLISFTLENWMSFAERATLNMVASKERQHGEHLARITKYQMRVTPAAAVYGGNASGKSNLFQALNFLKNLVVEGTKPDDYINVSPFRSGNSSEDGESRFVLELLINERVYELTISVTREAVLEEKLVEVLSTNERVLYHRQDGKIEFMKSLQNDDFMNFAFRGTRRNELFLTNSVNQNIEKFRPIYNWFKNQLELIAPDARFGLFEQFIQEEHPLYEQFNTVLSELDTGISRVGGEEVNFDSLPIPDSLKQELKSKVKEGDTVRIMGGDAYRFLVTRKEGQLIAKKIVTFHKSGNGEEVKFDLGEESDGTRRVIDLLPAFLKLAEHTHPKVFVFDELDRSLHTLLTQHFIKTFLNSCNADTRSQMLFTTHDVLVMDQDTMRRDEMWVTERDEIGNSVLFSFSNYKDVRYDKDLRKSYLQGRLGGVPRILRPETQSVASPSSQYGTKDAG